MPFPTTKEGLESAGYKWKGDGTCRSCHAPIEWWETNNGKNIPLQPEGSAHQFEAHFAHCPNAQDHRRK